MKYDRSIKWIIRLTLVLLFFLSGYVLYKLKPIWLVLIHLLAFISLPLLISAFITYLLHPIIVKMEQNNVPKWLAILFIYILFFGGTGLFLLKGLPNLLFQLQELAANAPEIFKTYQEWGNQLAMQMYSLPEVFHDRIEELFIELELYLDNFIEKAINTIKTFVNSMFVLIFVPFLVFYFLKDFDKIKTTCWYFTPKKWREHGRLLIQEIDRSLGQYIRGQLLVIAILCVLASVSFWMLGLPYPILLGIIVGVTEIIPYFGPILGAIPAIFIAMTISIKMVFWVIGIMIVLQLLEGSILSPIIVGRSLKMHPVMIILALLLGGEVAGVIGMILAVPFFAVLKVIITHFHRAKAKY
ncbi:AI-2E family transporter [Pueribacillus theae]|uniref:AI-2E family transporter n=1 Tax=Pueribacillus theae TaxID=2171751 RepID=A0A2U1K5P6_9BACI|nr:AI-2E family transporter [Pueribacillus theae]PWA12524.1 AI-2E family transporter [Pueribacillus theae]